MRLAIVARAWLAFAFHLSTGDDVAQETEHGRDGEHAITPGAREKPHRQPEVRRGTATPAVKQGRMSPVNLMGYWLHGLTMGLEWESRAASFDR